MNLQKNWTNLFLNALVCLLILFQSTAVFCADAGGKVESLPKVESGPKAESASKSENAPKAESPPGKIQGSPEVKLPVVKLKDNTKTKTETSSKPQEAEQNATFQTGGVNFQVCVACHGSDGNSPTPIWPKIAGQSENYLIKQMLEYKKGEKGHRFDPTMYGMTQNLSDQDIADLAAYFSSQKETPGSTEAQFLALGEKLYRGGNSKTGVPACIACHGPKGEGNSLANFPKISSQHAEYTMDQLKKFKAGTRSNDANSIMRDIAKRMSDEEIQAVSHYVSGLH